MNVSFYVVDEALLPEFAEDAEPALVIAAIAEHGGAWCEVATTPRDFGAAFGVLDRLIEGEDFLTDMAFTGSPGLVLTGHPGRWRLGWFEASLVAHLQPIIDASEDELAGEIDRAAPTARAVFDGFRDALEEARPRGLAVAILHGP
jgi:hypothetical protein